MDLFQDKELQEAILKSILMKDFFANEKPPVRTLKECLENCNDDVLNSIYTINCLVFKGEVPKKKASRANKISSLVNNIPSAFKEFFQGIDHGCKNSVENVKKGKLGNDEESNHTLLANGFVFGFTQNRKKVYVIPEELENLYQEYINHGGEKQHDLQMMKELLLGYLLINLIFPKDLFWKTITDYYQFNVTDEKIQKIEEELGLSKTDEYYSVINQDSEEFYSLVKLKREMSYRILSMAEYELYITKYQSMIQEIGKITKSMDEVGEYFWLLVIYDMDEDFIEELDKTYHLNSKKKKEIMNVLMKYESNRRYTNFNGRTFDEFLKEELIEIMALPKRPKKTDLKTCFSMLSREGKEELEEYHEVEDEKELLKEIINDFKK